MSTTRLGKFIRETDGVAAVEAALIFPLLVLLLIGGLETTSLLDSRRAIDNASFSLTNSAASLETIGTSERGLLVLGHQAILDTARVAGVTAVVKGYERRLDGSLREVWSWSPGEGGAPSNIAITTLPSNVLAGEGIVVAWVEGRHVSMFEGFFPSIGNFSSMHAQVPTKVSVPLYR